MHGTPGATGRLIILTFHSLENSSPAFCYPPALFAHMLASLAGAGWRSVDLPAAVDQLRRGQALPPSSIAVTFDDGYHSVYETAFPLLVQHRMTATVFLVTGESAPRMPDQRLPSMGGRMMLSWREIAEMQRHGISFGAHTLTHPDLTRLPEAEIERQLQGSQRIVEDTLSVRAETFAYPFGRYDARSRAVAARHFAAACSDRLALAGPSSDVHALPRLDAFYLRRAPLLALLPTPWLPAYVLACSIPRRLRRILPRRTA